MRNVAQTEHPIFLRGLVVLILATATAWAGSARGETIDLSYEYVEAGAVLDVYLGTDHYYWGNLAGDGLLRLNSSNPSGQTASLLKPSLWSYCMELDESTTFNTTTYTVEPLSSAIGAGQTSLIQQLWASHYDYFAQTDTPVFYGGSNGDFVPGEPANNAENLNAIAMAYAIFEIRYDYDGTLGSLDLTSGEFRLGANQSPLGPPSIQDAAQAMLDGLVDPQDYTGQMPELIALLSPSYQNMITEVRTGVPEPATLGLLAIGGLAILRRRKQSDTQLL